jgi:CRISPR system Cascade subunit CasB
MSAQSAAVQTVRDMTGAKDLVASIVHDEVSRLQAGVIRARPDAVGRTARLRRGAGRDVAAIPDLWGLLDLGALFAEEAGLTERERARAEKAVYGAVTLWALHQQSQRHRMHAVNGPDLGTAVRTLMLPGEIDDMLRKRLVRAGSAANFEQVTANLREIVQLLRRQRANLDYVRLARQLYTWQWPGGPSEVRREWGRGFNGYTQHQQAEAGPGEQIPDRGHEE